MNLVEGQLFDTQACEQILQNLQQRLLQTMHKGWPDPEIVISACGRLVSSLDAAEYLEIMANLGIDKSLGQNYLDEARLLFGEAALRARLLKELGAPLDQPETYTPPGKAFPVTERIVPLGVLLHVAAGNADGLPAFSVLEGLLTGNINILKLPAAEGGLSVRLLLELIRIEPRLAEYIYVFDYSSKDILHVSQLISVADAIIVWGGAEAISALRRLTGPNTRLIEWGHKVSFAYVTEKGITEAGLDGLAKNIAETGQLLCSSCQGIYVDTDDPKVVCAFCRQFLPILDSVTQKYAEKLDIGIKAQVALHLYNEELETLYQGSAVFRGKNCSLIAYPDRELKPAIQFGNAWVKALPRAELLNHLRPYKNFLQTAGLLCGDDEKAELAQLLCQAGLVRVCPAGHMSSAYSGAPHDGEYPLRRYTRIVSTE